MFILYLYQFYLIYNLLLLYLHTHKMAFYMRIYKSVYYKVEGEYGFVK